MKSFNSLLLACLFSFALGLALAFVTRQASPVTVAHYRYLPCQSTHTATHNLSELPTPTASFNL